MSRSIVSLAVAGVLSVFGSCLLVGAVSAQSRHHSVHHDSGHPHSGHHSGHHNSGHHAWGHHDSGLSDTRWCPSHSRHFVVPDIFSLDADSKSLAGITKHLHEDAHSLSQGYEHSRGIESFVSRLERLQEHMHGLLHQASNRGTMSVGLIRHIESDVEDSRRLVLQLDRELSHQAVDGATTNDFQVIQHMREIISNEFIPILRRMDGELRGTGHRSTPVYPSNTPSLPSSPLNVVPDHSGPVEINPIRFNPVLRRPARSNVRRNVSRRGALNL